MSAFYQRMRETYVRGMRAQAEILTGGWNEAAEARAQEIAASAIPAPDPEAFATSRAAGIVDKFIVHRSDGTDVETMDADGKHAACRYVVLDVTHDRNAIAAVLAYAEAVRQDGYEPLANELEVLAQRQFVDDDSERAVRIRIFAALFNNSISHAEAGGLTVHMKTLDEGPGRFSRRVDGKIYREVK